MHLRAGSDPARLGLMGLALAMLLFADFGVGAGAGPSPDFAVDVALDLADGVASRGPSGERIAAAGGTTRSPAHRVAHEQREPARRGGRNDPQAHASPLVRWRLAHSTSSGVD